METKEQVMKAVADAGATARRLTVWLAVKRVPEAVRNDWKKQLDDAKKVE